MADQHIGYPGSVDAKQLATWMPNIAGAQYSVEGPSDAKVIVSDVGARGIVVKKGIVCGDGIMDIFENDLPMNLNGVVSGDRWDMIVLRRTWNATPGSSTSVYAIIEGNSNKSLPPRNNDKGVISDQPIALCRVSANQNAVQEIVDLRCWAHNGGVYAKEDLVRSYIDQPGSHVTIGNDIWVRKVSNGATSDSDAWLRVGNLSAMNLFGINSQLDGDSTAATLFFAQAGTTVNVTDGAGYARLTWPQAFPNGLLTVVAMNGDDGASGATYFSSAGYNNAHKASGAGTKKDWVYAVIAENANGNQIKQPNRVHRINWIAIGW